MSYVSINSTGEVQVGFDHGHQFVFAANDPLLSATFSDPLMAVLTSMSTEGISRLHMETDPFRTFTHTIKGGEVIHAPDITNPIFAFLMEREAQLKAALIPSE